jgi:hypothetical protein
MDRFTSLITEGPRREFNEPFIELVYRGLRIGFPQVGFVGIDRHRIAYGAEVVIPLAYRQD